MFYFTHKRKVLVGIQENGEKVEKWERAGLDLLVVSVVTLEWNVKWSLKAMHNNGQKSTTHPHSIDANPVDFLPSGDGVQVSLPAPIPHNGCTVRLILAPAAESFLPTLYYPLKMFNNIHRILSRFQEYKKL